ncbi:hypothetical protein BDV96DRAFT_629390 [Lophiotrema nucula]|uniref:NAD(P)-binding protein n=1 Tax=Lophiotrema nucula TaxID=690887 RepID=A0A6A5ZGW0_9PLEO|nr:hypothetical protein BDV96DRAFT_629390 [Lophiotrema nucula]
MAGINEERDGLTLSHQFTSKMHRQLYPAIDPKNPSLSAAGKNVLITGATRGIGKSIALAWAEAGAAGIVVTGRQEKLLEEVADDLRRVSPKTKVVPIRAEATSEDEVHSLWAKVKVELGKIDILIANAGVFSEGNVYPVTGKMAPSQWWSDLDINIHGTYLQVYSFLQQYLSEGKEPTGTVIILSSGAAAFTFPGMSAYAISKLVGIRIAEHLNLEHPNVRSFAIHPGIVPTDMAPDMFAVQAVDPPEMASGLSLYLATSRAEYLRGSYVAVNWDIEEMEKHADEIREKKLLSTSFLNAKLGPEGHPFADTT